MTMQFKKQQSGMVIVLAILIIAAVIATAAAFGNLVIREIRQTRLIDQSIQAYYFAESGSERALHQVRKREAVVDCNTLEGSGTCDSNSHCTNETTATCINLDEGALNTLGTWKVDPRKEPETVITLSEGQTFQVDLFDINQTSKSLVNRVEITHNTLADDLIAEFTNLTKVLNISGVETAICLSQPPVLKAFIDTTPVRSFDGLAGYDLESACSYILKINYVQKDDGNFESTPITIKVFNTPPLDNQLPIPSRLIIDTNAIFGDSFQAITVRTPIRPPLSGLYDFVIFSEEDLEKITPP